MSGKHVVLCRSSWWFECLWIMVGNFSSFIKSQEKIIHFLFDIALSIKLHKFYWILRNEISGKWLIVREKSGNFTLKLAAHPVFLSMTFSSDNSFIENYYYLMVENNTVVPWTNCPGNLGEMFRCLSGGVCDVWHAFDRKINVDHDSNNRLIVHSKQKKGVLRCKKVW